MGNLCAIKTNFQIGPDNFEARFEGNGENQSFVQHKNLGFLGFLSSFLNSYVAPVLNKCSLYMIGLRIIILS